MDLGHGDGDKMTRPDGHKPAKRQSRHNRTRNALRAAAMHLFATNGYSATTVKQIAEAAEVSERTFFLHFPTKDAVLFGVEPGDLELFERAIAEEPPAVDDLTLLEGAILRWQSSYYPRNPDVDHQMTQLLVAAAQSSATLRGRELDYSEALARCAATALARRRGETLPRHADHTVAEVAIWLLNRAIIEWSEAAVDDYEDLVHRRFAELRAAVTLPVVDGVATPRPRSRSKRAGNN
jgi:AcrR family transcriptional regulator